MMSTVAWLVRVVGGDLCLIMKEPSESSRQEVLLSVSVRIPLYVHFWRATKNLNELLILTVYVW